MTEEHIGACIRMAMSQKELRSTQLAEILSKSVVTINTYRQGKCPSVIVLTAIAEACGMTFEEMMKLPNNND